METLLQKKHASLLSWISLSFLFLHSSPGEEMTERNVAAWLEQSVRNCFGNWSHGDGQRDKGDYDKYMSYFNRCC